MIPSTATVRFGPDGAPQVDASLRLTGSSQINCFTYPGKPPILAIDDAHVQVSITVPASGTVTPADIEELLTVHDDEWRDEVPRIEEHFAQFGDRLPARLDAQLKDLEARLS